MSEETVKVELNPVEQLVNRAKKEHSFTDPNGRVIVLRKPGPLAQFDLIEMLGGDTAQNQVYVGMCLPLTYIASIDGEPVSLRTKRELRALITRLDEEGTSAVHSEVYKNFGKQTPEEDKQKIKN